ncbi:MAG: glutamine synthetase family protein [Aquisalimonadaceae bacterium]
MQKQTAFAIRHGLWNDEQQDAARRIARRIDDGEIETVRLSFADQHGLLRGKTLVANEANNAMANGCGVTSTLLAKDTSHRTVFPVFTAGGGFGMEEMQGAADVIMIADPTTFKILPWAPKTGWVLCDLYFADGRPVPFSTRQLCRDVLQRLDTQGHALFAGLEVEFHVYRMKDPHLDLGDAGQPAAPPEVTLLNQGYNYLTEIRHDQAHEVIELLRATCAGLDLPLRTMECEYGPSQIEFTFQPGLGLASADLMVLFRSAVKQVCRRHGFHATFMCRPRIQSTMSSGWHLHQSLIDKRTGNNAFVPASGELLSATGQQYLAGLLEHAQGSAALSTPTINGYRRYRPYSLAPDRANWGRDNRGVMMRTLGGPGDNATRIENRAGEPAANPYLYVASQVISGLDGLTRKLKPGPSADTPYEADAPRLPHSLSEALDFLDRDTCLREGLGNGFVDYFIHIKREEIARFNLDVTAWEQREYFDLF